MLRRDLFQLAAAGTLASLAPAQTSSSSKKARLRTAICAYSFRKDLASKSMSYEDLVRLAVDLNVDGLDLTVYWLDTGDATLLPLRRLAYRNAVEIYSISVRTEMCKPAGAERDKEIAGLHKWVDVADKARSRAYSCFRRQSSTRRHNGAGIAMGHGDPQDRIGVFGIERRDSRAGEPRRHHGEGGHDYKNREGCGLTLGGHQS